MGFLHGYMVAVPEAKRNLAAIAYLAGIDAIGAESPQVASAIVEELRDQRSHLKLIASENFCSLPVQLAMGNLFTDKYAEGSPFHRFYAGCENVDRIEQMAVEELKTLFHCDHAYVQPHSGADANLVAFWSILVHRVQNREVERLGKKHVDEFSAQEYEQMRVLLMNQKIMGMSLNSGGHLTHGYRHNLSSKMMQSVSYEVDPVTGWLDYSLIQKEVKKERPAILVAGYSAYPRRIDFAKMREIADSVGATLVVDMAHFAGLVAGKVMEGCYDPIPFAHLVTSTTHKTLRGPRGGMVLCTKEFQPVLDKGCPLVLGGPLPHVIAAKAIAFQEAQRLSFRDYAAQIVKNAQALADELLKHQVPLITNGTDNHLVLVDVGKGFGLTGRQAEKALREAHCTLNRNTIPFDPQGPWYTSGIRMGTAALTTLGMKETEMRLIASWIVNVLKGSTPQADRGGVTSRAAVHTDPQIVHDTQRQVADLLSHFPLYPELIID